MPRPKRATVDIGETRGCGWSKDHEREANSCVVPGLANNKFRPSSTKRPVKGWARDIPVKEGQEAPEPPPGCTWFTEKDDEMMKPFRSQPQGFDNSTTAGLVSLAYIQVSHRLSEPDFLLLPYIVLDESLTMYASMMYSNFERSSFWPKNLDTGGNPRVTRLLFGRGPICNVGSWTEVANGETHFTSYGVYWPVHKRAIVLSGGYVTQQSKPYKSVRHLWYNDSYAWTFGDRIVDQSKVPDLFDDDKSLNLYFTIGPDRQLSNLPEELTWKHCAIFPFGKHLEHAFTERKLPICLADIPWPLTAKKIADMRQEEVVVVQPTHQASQVSQTSLQVPSPKAHTTTIEQPASTATPATEAAEDQELNKADQQEHLGDGSSTSEAIRYLTIYRKDDAIQPTLLEEDQDLVDEYMGRAKLIILDKHYGLRAAQERDLKTLQNQQAGMRVYDSRVSNLNAIFEDEKKEIQSLKKTIQNLNEALVQAVQIQEVVQKLAALGQHKEANSVIQNFCKNAANVVEFNFDDMKGLKIAREIVKGHGFPAADATTPENDERDDDDDMNPPTKPRKRRRLAHRAGAIP